MADTTTKATNGAGVADKPAENQALEKRTEVITTPTQFESALQRWTGRYNLLTPFTQITGLAPKHGIIASAVRIDSNPAKGGPGEVYDGLPFLQDSEVAIAKIGLRKIAEAAGISITTERTDPRAIQFLWEFKAIATWRGIDGTVVRREATAEWDLRDGSPRLKGWKPQQIEEGRKNGLRNAETRAINAAIREIGIKQQYHRRELEKPFLVLRVAWQPDPNNPDDMRLVGENAMRGTSTLYGGGALPAPAPHTEGGFVDAEPVEPRHVGSGSAEPAKADGKPDPNAPPTKDAVRIEKVEVKDGETRGKQWTRYLVIDSNGEACSTLDKSIGQAAERARDAKAWVELAVQTEGEYRNLIEIIPAGSEPRLPSLENL